VTTSSPPDDACSLSLRPCQPPRQGPTSCRPRRKSLATGRRPRHRDSPLLTPLPPETRLATPPNAYSFDSFTTLPTGAAGTYDHAGELASSVLAGTTTGYTYNADGQQLTSVQGTATQSAATWNGAGQLATYGNSAADMIAAAYDGNGLRASTTIHPHGGSAVTQAYAWNAQQQAPQLLTGGANAYLYTTGAAPAEQVSLATGTVTYLVADLLDSVRGTVSPAGALTATTAYDGWGNPETTGGLTAATPFGFAGGHTHPSVLLYLINRYYSPQLGQFNFRRPDLASTLQP
jgi:YD repeat-containing protein